MRKKIFSVKYSEIEPMLNETMASCFITGQASTEQNLRKPGNGKDHCLQEFHEYFASG